MHTKQKSWGWCNLIQRSEKNGEKCNNYNLNKMCHRLGQKLRHLQQGICNHGHVNVGAIIPSNTSNPQHMLGSSYNDPSIEVCTNIYLVCCAHSSSNNMPELIGGRMPSELLTFEGAAPSQSSGPLFPQSWSPIWCNLHLSFRTLQTNCIPCLPGIHTHVILLFFLLHSTASMHAHALNTHTHALIHSYNHFVVECICLNV